jgi:uncharacterized membrane protein
MNQQKNEISSHKKPTQLRHISKAITWRIVGTIDTIFLGWFVTGDISMALSIGGFEVVTKMTLYYLHERLWFKFSGPQKVSSNTRHLLKTITWRLIGTIDTTFLGWLISGDPAVGLKVGGLELITKMSLYYMHERIWYKSSFGLKKENYVERI